MSERDKYFDMVREWMCQLGLDGFAYARVEVCALELVCKVAAEARQEGAEHGYKLGYKTGFSEAQSKIRDALNIKVCLCDSCEES